MNLKNFIFLIIILCLFPIFTYSGGRAVPSISDFKIISFQGGWRMEEFYVSGEVKNIGTIPAGLKIEVIAKDSQGKLVKSIQFWPNNTKNIQPGSSFEFESKITEDQRANQIEIEILGVIRWQ